MTRMASMTTMTRGSNLTAVNTYDNTFDKYGTYPVNKNLWVHRSDVRHTRHGEAGAHFSLICLISRRFLADLNDGWLLLPTPVTAGGDSGVPRPAAALLPATPHALGQRRRTALHAYG